MAVLRPVPLLLTAAVGVVGANSLVLGPIAPVVAGNLGSETGAVLTASAGYGLAVAVSALTLAPQVDRIGAGRVVVLSLVMLALALMLSAAAPTVAILVPAQVLAGIAAGAALPAIYSLASEVAHPGEEAATLGLVLTGWTLALVAGVSVAGPVSEYLHWRIVYIALAVLGVLICLGLQIRLRGRGAPIDGRTVSPLVALGTPGIRPALFGVATFMMAFYGLYTWIGPHVQLVLERSAAATGLIPLSYGSGFGLAVLLDRVIDRMGAARMAPRILFLLTGIYLGLALSVGSFWPLVAVCFAWGLVNHLAMTLLVARLSALDPARRGAILGLYSATTYICVAIGVTLFRPIFESYGLGAAAAVSALCILPAAMQALRAAPRASVPQPRRAS
ncbi:MFS transporter [Roseobacter sp. HKCCA0434]|uniref:MFS transporter n=1 Tax=Roseobacter sp. HKCCA0434 TaxID=3079297 RepID=UPI002905EDF6|nr:MFS transporter [Roseobacter sp. HKCCA0434]